MNSSPYEELTGLLNRSAWQQAFEETLTAGTARGVVVLDLDSFSTFNHVEGHRRGDELLLALAAALPRQGLLLGKTRSNAFAAVVMHGDTEEVARGLWSAASGVCSLYETQALRDFAATSSQLHAARTRRRGDAEPPVPTRDTPVITVSAVAVSLTRECEGSESVLTGVYEALVEAKRGRRGQLVFLS